MRDFIRKNRCWLLLLAFIICVYIYTVLSRSQRISDYSLELFWSYREAYRNRSITLGIQIVLNIALFVPVGFIVSRAIYEKISKISVVLISMLCGFSFSFVIELSQFYFFRGTAEIDDVFDNTLGSIIGSIVFLLIYRIYIKYSISNKIVDIISIACVVVAIVACVMTNSSKNMIPSQLAFQVTHSNVTKQYLRLDGFSFAYGNDLMYWNFNPPNISWDDKNYTIAIKSVKTGEVQYLNTRTNIRNEAVNNYFKNRLDYPKTGFEASIDIDKINLDEEYEVLIKSGRLMLGVDTFIMNGKIEKSPSTCKLHLDVDGTGIEKVVRDGFLKYCNIEKGCAIYQYNRDLFWIMDKEYKFNPNEQTKISFRIMSTQINRVPQNVDVKKSCFVNDFIFEDKEITEGINTKKYRVAKMPLPAEFSIACIITGDDASGWDSCFRPRY